MARRHIGVQLIVSFAVLALAGPSFSQNGANSTDRSLAAAYLERAAALHGSGEDREAMELLGEALSLDGRSSDALYLLSLVDSPALSPGYSLRASRLARLEAAVALGRFERYSREEAAYALAEGLIAIKEYGRAASTLRGAFPHPWLEARAAHALIACAFFSGDMKTYRSGMADCFRRFPDDVRFPRFFLEHADREAASEADRSLRDSVMARLEALVAIDPELLALSVPFAPLKADRVRLLKRYRNSGGRGRFATTEALRLGIDDESTLVDEFWEDKTRDPEWAELELFYSLIGSKRNREAFLERLRSYSGAIAEDLSRDGRAENRAVFENGELKRWTYDPDQDGLVDLAMDFRDGSPVAAQALQQGSRVVIEYSNFPEARRATYESKGGTARLSFGSGGLSLPIASFKLPFRSEGLTGIRKPTRDTGTAIPVFDAAVLAAISIEEERLEDDGAGAPKRAIKALSELSAGVILRYREYVDGRPSLEREYSGGLPRLERFRYNEEGRFWEGRAEFERIASEPYFRKSYLALDSDGDGLFEYRESYFPVPRKEWDFDGDGAYDVAEEIREGAIVDYFSSRLDGVFDVEITIRDGRIVSVLRQGKAYPVTKESKADIYWIGKKPFDLGSSAPAEDGVYGKSGVRYIFYRSGSLAFAELIP